MIPDSIIPRYDPAIGFSLPRKKPDFIRINIVSFKLPFKKESTNRS